MDEGPNVLGLPEGSVIRRALRLAGWNALLAMLGLALIGLAGETWRRSTIPFIRNHEPKVFVPDVGLLLSPHTESRWTNGFDYWTISRTNSLGFLDREPPSPERAAESCHIAMIGDSFVEAKEVPIADKLHVRLEELAARALPALDVTTSAFGKYSTGQVNQLAFYDEYARPLRPRLVVLVFVTNDYMNNFPLWESLRTGLDPDRLPHVSAARAEDGGFRLRPPDPDYRRFTLRQPSDSPARARWRALVKRALHASWFLDWSTRRFQLRFPEHEEARVQAIRAHRMELLSRRPAHAPLLDGLWPVSRGDVGMRPADEDTVGPSLASFAQRSDDLPFYTEAPAFTAFALDEFKERAQRDGAALVILAAHQMHRFGGGLLARLNEMAAARGIPVIDQGGFIRRQGAELRDAHWPHDHHWNPAGHRWAAQALLEYLKRNRDVCE